MTEQPTRLVGVSIPRSGHHYLAALLQALLGDDLSYCEFYSASKCCSAIPCSAGTGARFTYQKGHDLDLSVPVDLPGAVYLVQFRDPVAQALSDRELFVAATGFTTPPTTDQYTHWLAGKAIYIARFAEKWLRHPLPNSIIIDYDRLLTETADVLDEICHRIGANRTREAIERVVAAESVMARRPPTAPIDPARTDATQPSSAFRSRRIEDSPFYDRDLLAEYESVISARVPEMASKRHLSTRDTAASALSALVEWTEATDVGDHGRATQVLHDALAQQPDHAYLHLAAGRHATTVGDAAATLAAYERAVELSPDDPEILFLLADAYRASGARERAVAVGRRIIAELPASAGHRLFHAVLLSEAALDRDALEEVAAARRLGLTDPHQHELVRQVTQHATARGVELPAT